jgi:TP901 family phage tail tape measure protein
LSELIAEARVLVTPDTTTFRAQLVAQTTAAAKGVTVPVAVTPVITGTSATNAALASQLDDVALAQTKVSTTADGFAESQKRVAQTATVSTKQLANLSKGASSAGLAFLGLRGATLAAGGGFLAGAASLSLFAKSVQSAASLETSLNTFRVTADATATEMERISDVAKELGADLTLPGVTAGSAADALAGLARAGLSVEDSVDGVRGVLQLGTAAAIDNATAVTLVATALNSFSLNGDQAVRVADLLAASSKQSQGSIEDMGLALSQAAAAAAQAGISVEDTVAILTQLGRAGLRGSDAGTSFRTAILRIVNPSKEAKAAIEGLGVELRDLQGNIRPEVFSEIATQAAKLGPAQRDATIALIGGQDAFRAISILGRAGAEGLDQMRAATQEVGAASDLASARTEGLAGSAANLQNQFQTLGLTVGEAASGPLQGFVDSLANSVSGLNNFIGFLGRIGDETPRAEQSISDLADEFVRLNEEAGGGVTHEQAVQNIREIGKSAAIATLDYAELVKEAGRANAEVARGSEKGFVSRAAQNEVERLNDELREVQSEGVGARDVIEGLRAGLDAAAGAAAGLTARLDESFDRFATTLPEPTAPPVTRKRVSSLQGDISLAQSEGDLRETERLQEKALANAIEAEEKGIHKGVVARQKLFDERRAAEIALNNTRKQIAAQNAADARTTAAEVARRQKEADEAFLQGQEDARTRQERSISIAADTPGLKDDIREQKENRDLIDRQIAAIKASSLTEKQKQAAIRELTAERNRTTDAIRELKQTDAEQREAAK